MGYDTGIRRRKADRCKGINMVWGSDGTALSTSAREDWLLGVSGGGGEIKVVRFFSKSKYVVCRVYLDAYPVVEQLRYEPEQLMISYGSCGAWGGIALPRYDTVNDKYVLEVHEMLAGRFGNSCDVGVYNPTAGSISCAYDVVYGVNSSVAIRQDRIRVAKLTLEDARMQLAKELDLWSEDVTMVKAGYWDEAKKENVDTVEAFVHPAIDAVMQKRVREFLAQFAE